MFVNMEVHIGEKIKETFTESGLSVTELARRIKTTRQNVYGIFERSSIDTALLTRLGRALIHNFFSYFIEETAAFQDNEASYHRSPRVTVQIEVDQEKGEELLRLAFGKDGAKLISKS